MRTALVTDSTAYLPAEVAAAHDVRVVPLHVVVGGREYTEGVDIDAHQVAEALRGFVPLSTSRPSPADFSQAYDQAVAAGAEHIISVHLSGELSSTMSGALIAASNAAVPVTVIDSGTLGMAMGRPVIAAAEILSDGASADDAAELIRWMTSRSSVSFYVDTLEYLRRGGRVGRASALVGSALSIKPILGLEDGSIVPLEKVRTSSRALARLEERTAQAVEEVASESGEVHVAVHHLDAPDRATRLADRLTSRLDGSASVTVVELGAVIGAHVGPGTLAAAVIPTPRALNP